MNSKPVKNKRASQKTDHVLTKFTSHWTFEICLLLLTVYLRLRKTTCFKYKHNLVFMLTIMQMTNEKWVGQSLWCHKKVNTELNIFAILLVHIRNHICKCKYFIMPCSLTVTNLKETKMSDLICIPKSYRTPEGNFSHQ